MVAFDFRSGKVDEAMNQRDLQRYLTLAIKVGLYIVPFLTLYISSSMLFPFITGRNFGFRIIIELVSIAWVGLLVLSPEHRPRLTWLERAVIALLFVVTLADILGPNPYRSFWSNYERMEGWLGLAHMTLFFFIVISVFRKFTEWRNYIYWSLGASVLVSLVAVAQKFGLTQSYQGGVRVDATIGNPAYLASYLMFHVFFIAFFFLRENRNWSRWILAIVAVFELWIIYLTATRGVILAVLAVAGLFAVAFLLRRPRGEQMARIIRMGSGIALIAGIVLVGGFWLARDTQFVRSNSVLTRFATLSLSERTVQSRTMIWNMAWQGVKERPILGWGQENFYLVFSKHFNPKLWNSEPWFDRSHNFVFDWMIHAGVIGLIAYLAVIVSGISLVWKAWRQNAVTFYEAGVLAGLFVAYLMQNFFVFDNFQSYFLLFLALGFVNFLGTGMVSGAVASQAASAPARSFGINPALGASLVTAIAMLAALYFLNVRPILASQDLIKGLNAARLSTIPDTQKEFESVLAYDSFGSSEAREQLANLARTFLSGTPRGSQDDVKKFVQFSISEMEKEAYKPAADAKHLLFLGSIYASALPLDPEYAKKGAEALQKALELSPTKQQVYFELASLYLNTGNPDQALHTLQKAVDLDPTFHGAHLNLALAAIFAGKNDVAEREFAEYRRLIPALDVDTIQRIINAYVRVNNVQKIQPWVEEALKLQPDNAQLYGQYAAILVTVGKREEAKAAARKAAELDPRFKEEADQFIKDIDAGKMPGQ